MIIDKKFDATPMGSFVKVAADIKKRIISAGCELHIDCAEELTNRGSNGADLWGANIYPEDKKIDFISLINIKPQEKNFSMDIQDENVKKEVELVIRELIVL